MANEFKVRKGLIVHGSGSTGDETILDIQGNSGQLFSVTDSLVGSLFTVSDISGFAVLEANSTGSVVGGSSTTLVSGSFGEGVSSIRGDMSDWDTQNVSGEILKNQPLEEAVSYGDLLSLGDDLLWGKTVQSDTTSATSMLGIALETKSSGNIDVLICGFIATTNPTVSSGNGLPMYIREGATGQINPNAPTTGGVVRVVGYAYQTTSTNDNSITVLRFDPDKTWVEL